MESLLSGRPFRRMFSVMPAERAKRRRKLVLTPVNVNNPLESGTEHTCDSAMTTSVNHEEALVKAFIPAHRQERFLEIIAKPKKRARLLTELSHFKALNPKFMVAIPSNQQNQLALAQLLRAKGAGSTCYVMSEDPPPTQSALCAFMAI